jgi:hypothetical protein
MREKKKIGAKEQGNCDTCICHLPDFITFFFIVEYVALIKQAVVERRR